jgi:exodeoxyribonuclease VII large subunit
VAGQRRVSSPSLFDSFGAAPADSKPVVVPKPPIDKPRIEKQAAVTNKASVEKKQETLTVGSLTKALKTTLENMFSDVVVEGEISNFTDHRSGHRYFTLKDPEAQISCVFWKTRSANFKIKDGMKVVCRGRLTVYPPRGNYQLDVLQIRPLGVGELQMAFEALYARLKAEGLFEVSRKRPIPRYPKVIGIVTSETGAALQDILTVLRRRYPIVRVVVRPATVQGVGAELQIARAIQEFNLVKGKSRPDVLIVGRGGGSLEDLWSFNEEAVARAIFTSKIPIISAVGHEVDVTIADFVADLRAPTPTAAAELATPDRDELLGQLGGALYNLEQSVTSELRHLRRDLESSASIRALRSRLLTQLDQRSVQVSNNERHIRSRVQNVLEKMRLTLERDQSKLSALNPYGVLERGYALVETLEGGVVTRVAQLASVSNARLIFVDGKADIQIAG